MNLSLPPLRIALLAAAGFCVYEAVDVLRNGEEVFYDNAISREYRGEAATKWLLGAAALGVASTVVK